MSFLHPRICFMAGILLLVVYTDITEAEPPGSPRDSILLPERHIDTLPQNIRKALVAALSAKGRETHFLTTNSTLETASIIGGQDSPDHKYPWFARMVYFWYDRPWWTWCGASVYNKKTIITAAHCVDYDIEQVEGFFAIHTGHYAPFDEEGLEQITMVDKVIMHTGYRYSGLYFLVNDIALMITDEPLRFTTIAVRPLPSLSTRRKDKVALRSNNCVVIGYGVTHYNPGRVYADTLQELSPVPLASHRECNKALWEYAELGVSPKMICARWGYAGDCNGDSGGPVGCYNDKGEYFQVGIVSWGRRKNGRCFGESVYTRISQYLRWIKHFSYKL